MIDSALLFCGRQSGRWRTVAMRDTPPSSLLNPGQPRPQGAPFFCLQVSTFAGLLSEFWLNLNAKECSLWSERSQWKVLSLKKVRHVKADKNHFRFELVNTCKNAESVFCLNKTLIYEHKGIISFVYCYIALSFCPRAVAPQTPQHQRAERLLFRPKFDLDPAD